MRRIGGYVALRNRTLSPRTQAVLQAAPGCVLISVIVPHFVSDGTADLVALAITIMTAMRLPMMATVVIGVASAGLLRQILG